jgi:predicted DNA-binding transcriptional regulator YafY
MSNPTTRVLALLELLQTHGRTSGRELARMLGVGARTLRRYITTLEEIGIPITAERGRDGGYMLVAGFKLPPMVFTNEETLAISLGLIAARSLGAVEAAPAVASAQAKLERVMPQNLQRRLRTLSDTVTVDLAPASTTDRNVLATLTDAAQSTRRVHFSYVSREEESSQREFDPYGLVFRNSRWYAVGHCHLREDIRTFRLDRLMQLRKLDATFQRPRDFDAAAHLNWQFIDSGSRSIPVELLLHTNLTVASAELGGGLLLAQREGVRWQAQACSLSGFARHLTQLPFRFEILQPPELKTELRKQAERLLAML